MPFSALPTELRMYIWSLIYTLQPPRYVTFLTHPHDTSHAEPTFCPRSSPTPPPTALAICRESRTEALALAHRAGHIVRLPCSLAAVRAFVFRFGVDVLLYEGGEGHFDDSAESGVLVHFRALVGGDGAALTALAVGGVRGMRRDGGVSNCMREFPRLTHLIFIAAPEDMVSVGVKEEFVRAAAGVVGLYEFDRWVWAEQAGGVCEKLRVDVAVREGRELKMLPCEEWRAWASPELDWGPVFLPEDHPYWQRHVVA